MQNHIKPKNVVPGSTANGDPDLSQSAPAAVSEPLSALQRPLLPSLFARTKVIIIIPVSHKITKTQSGSAKPSRPRHALAPMT